MNICKEKIKWKKCISCLMAMLLVVLSCDAGWAAEPEGHSENSEFTDGFIVYRVIDEDNRYVGVAGLESNWYFENKPMNIPSEVTYDGVVYSVKKILKDAFSNSGVTEAVNLKKISTVNIPYGVTEICDDAFMLNASLSEINIPDSVTTIGSSAFFECGNLKNVEIPGSVEKIGRLAFGNCNSFTEIIIPEGVKEIEEQAFCDCKSVKKISLPATIEIMGNEVFYQCGINIDELTVIMKEGLTLVGERAFGQCDTIKEIIIPDTVKKVGKAAFSGCENLKSIEITNNVTMFDIRVFVTCKSFQEIRIKEDKNPITALSVDVKDNTFLNSSLPADRKLVFLNSDGTKELAGTSLAEAQKAYMAADDGDTTDNLWWGWQIGDLADLYTVTVEVEKDGEKWEDHGKQFLLKNENGYLIDDFQAENGTYTVCVKIGETVVDTGVTVEVKDSDTSVTIEYFTATFYDGNAPYENDTVWGQQIVRKGENVIKPSSEPQKKGFKFDGWKTDKEGSRAFDFGTGINDTTNIYASWSKASEEPSKPAETEKPTDTEKPSDTNKPTDTEKPSDTNKPTDTEKPSDTSKPTDTENPSDTNKPTDTEKPTAPSKPTDTEKPTAPSNPADTETATSPSNTAGSETPSTPSPSLKPNGSPEIEEPEASASNGGAEKGEKPKTGDTNHIEIYATAAMIAGLSYVMLIFARSKEGMTEEEKNIRVSALIEWSRKGSRLRRYAAFIAIFFLLLYYHGIDKRVDLEWEEICGK